MERLSVTARCNETNATERSLAMRIAEDDYDSGTILLTVIVTVVLGGMVYAYNSRDILQTASLPAIERTVPTVVPSQPGL
jgi:hypothetical protein